MLITWCVANLPASEKVDVKLLTTAALLHDIGTYVLFDDGGKVANKRLYPLHAILGAKIIADEGIDKRVAQIVETHVLLGLSEKEIIEKPWPLPTRDYIPDSIEGELLCYADRFHSKEPTFNAYDTFLARLKAGLPEQAAKFEKWSKRFGHACWRTALLITIQNVLATPTYLKYLPGETLLDRTLYASSLWSIA